MIQVEMVVVVVLELVVNLTESRLLRLRLMLLLLLLQLGSVLNHVLLNGGLNLRGLLLLLLELSGLGLKVEEVGGGVVELLEG